MAGLPEKTTVTSLKAQLNTLGRRHGVSLPTAGTKESLSLRVHAITEFTAWCAARDWSGDMLGVTPRVRRVGTGCVYSFTRSNSVL